MIPPIALVHKDRLLTVGTVLTRSETIAPRAYDLVRAGDQPAIVVRGDGITIDFQGATLRGSALTIDPDQRQGVGLRVEGRNVTIKNAKIRGYKVGVLAKGVSGLKLVNCDLSYNWKQRLKSTREKEDLGDWMSYHQNEKGEWLRYGAAAYLDGCEGFEVKGCRVNGGQNALMLNRSNGGLVWNNDFSYNSSLGIGMYRSSRNRIMHNQIDYCVRGYSHGVYNRGQDSAGILVYEQSSGNTFAYNSVTHGGDGFFLWAGQSTMDTGKGGCNDNLVYGNDFSYAPTNGVEITFSRNKIVNNRVAYCWHGIWGGYSYDTDIVGNTFGGSENAIAIEHGQDNRITDNRMIGDDVALKIWQSKTQDPDWGYPKQRDTRSRDLRIERNVIAAKKAELDVASSTNVYFHDNDLLQLRAVLTGENPGFKAVGNTLGAMPKGIPIEQVAMNEIQDPPGSRGVQGWSPTDARTARFAPKPLTGGRMTFPYAGQGDRRRTILVDEWGPYDGRSVRLWPALKPDAQGAQKFSVLGPKGRWRLVSAAGVQLSSRSGSVPGSFNVTRKGGVGLRSVKIAFTSDRATTDYRGITTPAGATEHAVWQTSEYPIAWSATFGVWKPGTEDPRTQRADYDRAVTQTVASWKGSDLDFTGYGRFVKGVPASHFGTEATGTFTVPKGRYRIETTADDGVIVELDGKTVTEAWKYQGPTTYLSSEFTGGVHSVRVRHFQIDGYSQLKVRIVPLDKN